MAHPFLPRNNHNRIHPLPHHRKRFPNRQSMDILTHHLYCLLGFTAIVARSPDHAVLPLYTSEVTAVFEGGL